VRITHHLLFAAHHDEMVRGTHPTGTTNDQ
jgi:hypothetical protein